MVIEIRERKNYITEFLLFVNMVNVPRQNRITKDTYI